MGGGDLNSKKSWHPSTMKNQERIWKAEQVALEEKKRILELQQERALEKDREELNQLAKLGSGASASSSDHLNWMYNKPDKKANDEDYLLGKAIGSNFDKTEPDVIPAVARRVVGSSMMTASGDVQVDLARKLREDPLLMVKERERAARAALLNNPLQRRRLTELLRKEQEQKQIGNSNKKSKSKNKALDNMLAEKLNALGGKKGLDLAALLQSDDSDSSSSKEHKKLKKKQKKSKKPKKKKKSSKSETETDSSDDNNTNSKKAKHKDTSDFVEHKKRKSDHNIETYNEKRQSEFKVAGRDSDRYKDYSHNSEITKAKKHDSYRESERDEKRYTKQQKLDRFSDDRRNRHIDERDKQSRKSPDRKKRGGMSEQERAAKLAAMASAGAERERDRERRVAQQRTENEKESSLHGGRPRIRNEARSLPDSLESRIHSNRHYIQRDSRHMNENFAKR